MDGDIMSGPSEDEFNPYFWEEDSAAHAYHPSLGPGWNHYRDGQHAEFPGSSSTPRGAGSLPNAPSSERQKVSERDKRRGDDRALAGAHRAEEPDSGFSVAIAD